MKKYFITTLIPLSIDNEHLSAVQNVLKNSAVLPNNQLENQPNVSIYNQEAETLKIQTVREIIEDLSYSTYQGKKRVVILLHVDQASLPAQNALLKVIEEPPANTQIILTCSSTRNIVPTILSRCKIVKKSTQSAQLTNANSTELETARSILKQLLEPGFSYKTAIELAEEYKDRDTAEQLVTNLISVVTGQLEDPRLVTLGKTLLDTCKALQQNLNTMLVMEHLFFTAIQTK